MWSEKSDTATESEDKADPQPSEYLSLSALLTKHMAMAHNEY